MVALKHDPRGHPHQHRPAKQERRGGIETELYPLGLQAQQKKQERRGGIETASISTWSPSPVKEAGTPWWH